MSSFFKNGFKMVPLATWLDWVSGRSDIDSESNEKVFIALPMIQRGSVWKPLQIINLWDSLLRGMPVGSLMLSQMKSFDSNGGSVKVRKINSKKLEGIPDTGGLGLLDGQQRTLALLTGWPGIDVNKTIWIDFADDQPGFENLFRFHVTTKNQKFGFQRQSPNSKLPLHERSNAVTVYEKLKDQFLVPWDSYLPIEIESLIRRYESKDVETYVSLKLKERINAIKAAIGEFSGEQYSSIRKHLINIVAKLEKENANILLRTNSFEKLIEMVFESAQIPLIQIQEEFFDTVSVEEGMEPPLAILFKRIGSGGTSLTDADYIYSVIKNKLPESYGLVENLANQDNILKHLNATNVVMTAVRLVAEELGLTDHESPTKVEFHRLLTDKFSEKFVGYIENSSDFVRSIKNLTDSLEYSGYSDIGLPRHAWILIGRPLVQVILRWLLKIKIDEQKAVLDENRKELIKFILYWVLCVKDARKASTIIYKLHKNNEDDTTLKKIFQGGKYAKILIEEGVSIPLVSPDDLNSIETRSIILSPADVKGLRGSKRFEVKKFNDTKMQDHFQRCINLYSRWWSLKGNHIHPLLLWLQRDLVSTFKGCVSADSEEDTPYDFDHICPSNHWHGWTGIKEGQGRLCDINDDPIADKQGYWRLGNSIGNVRVLDSSVNRSYGDAPPVEKLHLGKECKNEEVFIYQNDIDSTEYPYWVACSEVDPKKYKIWGGDGTRALAFQKAIELRAFNLYKKFYTDLCFSSDYEWESKEE